MPGFLFGLVSYVSKYAYWEFLRTEPEPSIPPGSAGFCVFIDLAISHTEPCPLKHLAAAVTAGGNNDCKLQKAFALGYLHRASTRTRVCIDKYVKNINIMSFRIVGSGRKGALFYTCSYSSSSRTGVCKELLKQVYKLL